MSIEELIEQIQNNTEWLSTTEEDDVECISIENLEGLLTTFFNKRILISEEHEQ
jgi:hypothetical protein